MNQNDYKDKIPAVDEEPNEYPPEYQAWLNSQEPTIEELDKWADETEKRIHGIVEDINKAVF